MVNEGVAHKSTSNRKVVGLPGTFSFNCVIPSKINVPLDDWYIPFLCCHEGFEVVRVSENIVFTYAIPEFNELNIGHSLIADALFVGLPEAVKKMKALMLAARESHRPSRV